MRTRTKSFTRGKAHFPVSNNVLICDNVPFLVKGAFFSLLSKNALGKEQDYVFTWNV